jgi:hypothetical protein
MSTLFLCRVKEQNPVFDAPVKPVESISLNSQYYYALDCWGWNSSAPWLALEELNGLALDDCIEQSIQNEEFREMFCGMLLRLVAQCREAAMWYAGFPEDIATVGSADEFVRAIRNALAEGEIEPSVRMVC